MAKKVHVIRGLLDVSELHNDADDCPLYEGQDEAAYLAWRAHLNEHRCTYMECAEERRLFHELPSDFVIVI